MGRHLAGDDFEGFDAGQDDERTAIVDVADIRRAAAVRARDRHVLVRMDGSNVGSVISLDPERSMTIGRHTECDVWINDDGISRRHARVSFEGGAACVEDLGSANGSFVRGERVAKHTFLDGDIVQLGPNVLLRYSVTDSDEEAMLKQLYEASVRDPLTGAYNREHFEERMKAEVAYARRHNTDTSLALLDLDHFKSINDNYGHQAGDSVLIEIAREVTKGLRVEDLFARYGGEEFAVVLRGIDLAGAQRVGERLRVHTEGMRFVSGDRPIPVTMSVGCASVACCDEPTVEALVAIADRRLYAAKRGGRNRVVATG